MSEPETEEVNKYIANYSSGVTKTLNMIDHGIKVTKNEPLHPLSKHRSERIFSLPALGEYFYEEGRIDFTTTVRKETTEASSAFELSKKFESNITVSGQAEFLAKSISATAVSEYKYERNTKTNTDFAQVKHFCELATIDMPRDSERLRTLLDDEFKANIDSVNSMKDARKFVQRYGGLYIAEATWGGSLTLTSSSQMTETTTSKSLLTSLETELEFLKGKVSTKTEIKDGLTVSEATKGLKYILRGIGGKPHLVNDAEAWMESVSLKPALVDIRVGDISILAVEDSPQQEFLRQAVEEYSNNFEDLFGDDLFMKTVIPPVNYSWHKGKIKTNLYEYKKYCVNHRDYAKSKKHKKVEKKKNRKRNQYIKAAEMGIEMCKELLKMLDTKTNATRFFAYIEEEKKKNQAKIDGKYHRNSLNQEHKEKLNEVKRLVQDAGTLGMANENLGFVNVVHSRLLELDSKHLKAGNVINKSNPISNPDSTFLVKVVDHQKGEFVLENTEHGGYLTQTNNKLSLTDQKSTKFKFFIAGNGRNVFLKVKAGSKTSCVKVVSPKFDVVLVPFEKRTNDSLFILTMQE